MAKIWAFRRFRGGTSSGACKWFDKPMDLAVNVYKSHEDIFLHMEILRHFGFSDLQAGEAIVLQVVDGQI